MTRQPRPGARLSWSLQLAAHLEGDNRAEERDAFDECREDQRSGLDTTSHFGLTRHAIRSLTTDTADADAGTDHGETSAEAGAEADETTTVVGRCLQHWDDRVNHCHSPKSNCCTPSALADRIR